MYEAVGLPLLECERFLTVVRIAMLQYMQDARRSLRPSLISRVYSSCWDPGKIRWALNTRICGKTCPSGLCQEFQKTSAGMNGLRWEWREIHHLAFDGGFLIGGHKKEAVNVGTTSCVLGGIQTHLHCRRRLRPPVLQASVALSQPPTEITGTPIHLRRKT